MLRRSGVILRPASDILRPEDEFLRRGDEFLRRGDELRREDGSCAVGTSYRVVGGGVCSVSASCCAVGSTSRTGGMCDCDLPLLTLGVTLLAHTHMHFS